MNVEEQKKNSWRRRKKRRGIAADQGCGSYETFFSFRTKEKRRRSFLRDERQAKDVVFCLSDAQRALFCSQEHN